MDTIAVDPYYTLIVATLVLLVGRLMVDRIKFLQDFNIPEPVAGGLLAAVIIYILQPVPAYRSPSTRVCRIRSC